MHDVMLRELSPPRRARIAPRGGPARGVRFAGWVVVGLVAVRLADGNRAVDCAAAVRTQTLGLAASICRAEYDETGDPATGIRLADSLRMNLERARARALAGTLLGTSVQADAWQLLANIARSEGRLEEATVLLEHAREQHRAVGARGDVARDSDALAKVLITQERYAEALLALDECITETRAIHDPDVEYVCHLNAELALLRVGLMTAAERELQLATQAARSMRAYTTRERAWLEYARGKLAQDSDRGAARGTHDRQAIAAFRKVLALNQLAQIADLAISTKVYLGRSLVKVGEMSEAELHLADANLLDVTNTYIGPRMMLAAQIAYHRGNLALAATLSEQAYKDATADRKVEVAVMQARIALANGELAGAELWAQRGIDSVEQIRGLQSALELRPWILSSRRVPYELRFLSLARAGRIEDALLALDQWQGRTMLDALATPPAGSLDLRDAAGRVKRLGTWLSVATTGLFARSADRRRVLDTLQAIDVLVLLVADGNVWCLTSNRGERRAHDLGPLASLQARFDAFVASPTDPALAAELGDLLLRDGIARHTPSALHVMLDGPLAALPVVALRHAGRPLIAARPVLRMVRLPEAPCAIIERPTRATVLADVTGDLPDARAEATAIAAVLGLETALAIGRDATSEALFAATDHDVLHVAVHSAVGVDSGVLELADRSVSALEISARKLRAPLVVLAACESARSDDAELSGSLASAFLAAGSPQVIATLRAVSDAGARELVDRFFRGPGLADPVRTLAEVQAVLADTGDVDWPRFTVFGQELCSRASED